MAVRRHGRRSSCMSIVLGAELGPKADPTTTTYMPRPEWYFFFLFELLRVIKPPELVPLATIGVPTICMILLFLLPFYDRGPERRPERRPIATTAGIFTIAAMGYLTYLGAAAGSPTADRAWSRRRAHRRAGPRRRSRSSSRASRSSPSRAAWPATRSARTATTGPGPELTDIGDRLPRAGDRAHARQPDGADAVVRRAAERAREVRRDGRLPRRSSRPRASSRDAAPGRDAGERHPRGAAGPGDVRPHRRRSTTS